MFCVWPSLPEMWYWVFLWCLFSSLFVHGAAGLLMLITLQRHKRGRLITLVLVSVGFLASLSGSVITSRPPTPYSAPLSSLLGAAFRPSIAQPGRWTRGVTAGGGGSEAAAVSVAAHVKQREAERSWQGGKQSWLCLNCRVLVLQCWWITNY